MSCNRRQNKQLTKAIALKAHAESEGASRCMVIIGIDPGLRATGYAVIRSSGIKFRLLEAGVIVSSPKKPLSERLKELFEGMSEVVEEFSPDMAALEHVYCRGRFERSALLLGHVRGAVCAAMAFYGLPIAEYTFTNVKRTVVGKGNATKRQLHEALRRLIGIADVEAEGLCEHAMDALALAVCHALSQPIKSWLCR
ncbi:MAG: crossover junction endodeoxyribonuclease RuvC [Armatimonadota bacterium]|nr:crossover junction endodeoxyribonuclease RuvC [Armatimonadota bacterium]MCX7777735.1 crossover junction endodeoxyribonuclease RuvC [Armatimonadota bacterium]MDW8026210.1 crossover junction endodeoxyribonuclease RuvC [Armatimonadota bacterium]